MKIIKLEICIYFVIASISAAFGVSGFLLDFICMNKVIFLFDFSAPSAPLQVMFTNIQAHSFIVYWKKPEKENGVLTAYRIQYSFWNGTHSVSNTTEVNNVVEKKLTNLYSFVNYTVKIQAKTVSYGAFSKPGSQETQTSSTYLLYTKFFLLCLNCFAKALQDMNY